MDTNTPLYGAIRAILAAAGGFLVGRGIIDGVTLEAIAGAGATIAVTVWSIFSKRA